MRLPSFALLGGLSRLLVTTAVVAETSGASNHPSTNSTSNGGAGACTGIKAINPACNSVESAYRRDVFFVGGQYIPYNTTWIRTGQLYVEKLTRADATGTTKPYPLVLISAGVPAGNVWLNTPDNRKGWASLFLDRGYAVYIVDITANGRSGQNDLAQYSPLRVSSTVSIHENGFTAPEDLDAYPQSQGHDQWVGNGTMGDAVFDAFFAATTPLTSNTTAQELSMRASGCELLALIGPRPAYVVSHSAGATYAALLSDECPERVRATINLEPGNIPFQSLVGNATVPSVGRTRTRPWGLTNTRITYDPPVQDDSKVGDEIRVVEVGVDLTGNRSCFLQDVSGNNATTAARTLTQIATVPYIMFTAANSPHITYDHCMYSFLEQAGVKDVTWIQLGRDRGIEGNGHFFFLESNSEEIFKVVAEEIDKRN